MINSNICNYPSLPPQKANYQPEYNDLEQTCRPQNVVNISSKSIELTNKPNEINIITSGEGGCLEFKDLIGLVSMKAREVRSSFTIDDIVILTNEALETLWNMNNGSIGWNWTLRDYEIVLDGDSAKYRLPNDFNGLSGVSFSDTRNGKVPSKGYFGVVEAHQWDSVQFGNYVMYRHEDDGFYMYVRTREMNCWCDCGLKLQGSIFVKYYTTAPRINALGGKICGLPIQWGVKKILVDMIAMEMYSAQGKQYPQSANLEIMLNKLMKLDRGEPLRDNLHKNQTISFKMIR